MKINQTKEKEEKYTDTKSQPKGGERFTLTDVEVSLFENYYSQKPCRCVKLFEWLLSNQHKEEVIQLRKTRTEKKRLRIKMGLPCITPSGLFSIRKSKGLIEHSGYICIDIDHEQNQQYYGKDWFKVKSRVAKLFDSLVYAGMSVSGNGIFLIFRIAYPEQHKQQFDALVYELKERARLQADTSCSDIARLRGVSYDDYPFFNPEAIAYTKVRESKHRTARIRDFDKQWDVNGKVKRLIRKISVDKIDITADYNDWYRVGCALANEYGPDVGRNLFHRVSTWYDGYDPRECDEQFARCCKSCDKIRIETFFYICKKHGVTFKD